MDPSKLHEICKSFSGTDYHVEPIPTAKAKGARTSLGIRSASSIVALIDFTILGGAENAMVVTEEGICWKSIGNERAERLTWQQLSKREICEKKEFLGKRIDFGNGVEMSLAGAGVLCQGDNHLVVDLLSKLKEQSAQTMPIIPTGMAGDITSAGLVECEYCKKKVKPDVTYCKHCGIRLRG